MSVQIIISVVMVFFVLIGIHEFGHFLFAKRAGILVREFAIGFGPKLFSFRKGETVYTLRLLPIGGFVRMAGEETEQVPLEDEALVRLTIVNELVTRIEPLDQNIPIDSYVLAANQTVGRLVEYELEKELWIQIGQLDGEAFRKYPVDPQAMIGQPGSWWQIAPKDRLFNSKSILARFLTIFAGPFMNGLLAFVLFMAFVFLSGMPTESARVKLGDIDPGTQAALAGLQKGDEIISMNGKVVGDDWNLVGELITNSPDQAMTWVIDRNGTQLTLQVTPKLREYDGQQRIMVGIRPHRRVASIGEAFQGAGLMMGYFTENILLGFKKLFTGDVKLDDLGGPVRTVNVTAQYAAKGIDSLMYWGGILSLYLGLFNLLPIPALDGSRIVFLFVEAVRGRPVPPNRESIVHLIGFSMMMLLMLFVTYNDITRLFR